MRCSRLFALLPVLLLCGAPTIAAAAVDVSFSVSVAPPELPDYEQPPLPEPGYLWSPGYWAWDGMDYYWVPGTWVLPPADDLLWTPGYWSWRDGFYGWTPGYWGPEVGYYGGVNYGYGYTGIGFQGGYWHGGAFFYNRAVANFGAVRIVNVYSAPIQIHERSRVSFNGGQGGLHWRPNAAERTAMNEHHREATPLQREHQRSAANLPSLHVGQNGGRPQILATQRPSDFAHPGPGLRNHQEPRRQEGGGTLQPQARPQPEIRQSDNRQQSGFRPQPEIRAQSEPAAQGEALQRREGNDRRHNDEAPQRFPQQPPQPQQQPRYPQPQPQQPPQQQQHEPRVAGPGPSLRTPDRLEGPRPEVRGGPPPVGGGAPQAHGEPPHAQAPRPQGAREQERREKDPKRER